MYPVSIYGDQNENTMTSIAVTNDGSTIAVSGRSSSSTFVTDTGNGELMLVYI